MYLLTWRTSRSPQHCGSHLHSSMWYFCPLSCSLNSLDSWKSLAATFLCVTASREKLCGLGETRVKRGGWWLKSAPLTAVFAWLAGLLYPLCFPGQDSLDINYWGHISAHIHADISAGRSGGRQIYLYPWFFPSVVVNPKCLHTFPFRWFGIMILVELVFSVLCNRRELEEPDLLRTIMHDSKKFLTS